MAKRVWLTWEDQRRNRTVSQALDAALLEIDDTKSSRLRRYAMSVYRTLSFVRRERPSVIFASNPSMALALVATRLGKSLRVPVVIDAHNAGVRPFEGKEWWANRIASHLIRSAAITIVHNDDLKAEVTAQGGRPFVLPDPIPSLPTRAELAPLPELRGKRNVFYVCTYEQDEPYLEVVAAAEQLPPDVFVYISGRRKDRLSGVRVPDNVVPTGFLAEQDYVRMLYAADVILVLTTWEQCLCCGAYEAVAAGTPLVLTGTSTLRGYFSRGAVYTGNGRDEIARSIRTALDERERLEAEIRSLGQELVATWGDRRDELVRMLPETRPGLLGSLFYGAR